MNAVYACSGMRLFGERMARILDVPLFVDAPCGDVDTVLICGMYDPPYYATTLANTKRAKRRVIYWCGTDVQMLSRPDLLPAALHIAEWENLRAELFDKGVDAVVATLPPTLPLEVTPLPDKPVVAVYVGSHAAKYGGTTVKAVMDAMPDTGFLVYPYGTYSPEQMPSVIAQCSVLLRLTRHDGAANSAREFMQAGRRVVCTADLPYARVVRPDDLVQIVSALRSALKQTEPDYDAAAYWVAMNDPADFALRMEEVGVWQR